MPELAKLFDAHVARDPTQTVKLRKAFRATAKMRLRQLRAAMRTAVIDHNVLGFSRTDAMSFHPPQVRLQAFAGWFNGTGGQILLGDAWARTYIMRAWQAGEVKAIREVGAIAAGPDRSEAIIALARVEIEGILSVTAQQVTRQAASIIARGTRRHRALRQLFAAFDKVAQPRLVVMCDVLAIKAYNEAKLSTYTSNGVRRVGVQAETLPSHVHQTSYRVADAERTIPLNELQTARELAIGAIEEVENVVAEEEHLVGILTAGDDRVCQECEDWAEGSPYEIEEVRDVYPLHPRCRCAVYPWEDLRFKGDAGFDPSEPREEHGKWTAGGGGGSGATHPGAGYSAKAYLDKAGVIHTSNVYDAQLALFQNRHVELKQVKQVSTLIQRLGETAAEMAEHGEAAPVFNLCLVSVEGTNLFCAEHKGIPRIKMPVIRAKKTKEFVKHLKSKGYKVEKSTERADHLRATQDEIDGAKVAISMERIKKEGFYKRIIVSRDNYILDGHHTWAGQLGHDARDNKLFDDKHVKVARVDIGIIQLLKEAEEWTGGAGKKAAGQDGVEDKYNPSQPRDPAGTSTGGQWTALGGGGSYEFVSPNVESGGDPKKAITIALANIRSDRQRALHKAQREIDTALGMSGTRHDAVGAWKDGAEHTIVTRNEADEPWEKVRVNGAMKGHLGDQKQVLLFKQEDGGGSALYHMSVTTDNIQELHENLIKDGLAFHTVVPHTSGGGADVIVADLDGSSHDAMARAAERYNADVQFERGKAEFIGTTKEDGTDREQRDDARRAYEEIIEQSTVQGSQKVWKKLHTAWGEALGVVTPIDPNAWGANEGLVASRKVSAKTVRLESYARPDITAMQTDPKGFEHNVGLFSIGTPQGYTNFKPGELTGTPAQRARQIVEHMKSNIRFLYANAGDVVLKSGAGWYDKAHDMAVTAGKRYGISERAAAGVIAALSPQKDWNQNIYLAHAVMEINHSHRNEKWSDDPAMVQTATRIWKAKDKEIVERVQDKTLGELTDAAEKAVWIRTYDEAHSDRSYHDFDTGELVTKKGKKAGTREPARAAWQSIPAIASAVSALDSGGDLDIISDAVGTKHKVRSFYNNIIAPRAPNGDVTIDTHAVGVALLRPLSGKTIPVMHALGTAPQKPPGKRGENWKPPEGWRGSKSSEKTGLSGTYAIYADAYREVAAEVGILPQQLQAVTWQAKRILFAGGPLKRAAVEREWLKYQSGEQDLATTQQNVLTVARAEPGDPDEDDEDDNE